eukprot:2797-Pelagococcus_subviridis.AAC.4
MEYVSIGPLDAGDSGVPLECNGANRAVFRPVARERAAARAAGRAAAAAAARRTLPPCSLRSITSNDPGNHLFGGVNLNLIDSSSDISLMAASASARSSRECAAETQKRTRGYLTGVAGAPTTTVASLRLNASLEKSPILYGW